MAVGSGGAGGGGGRGSPSAANIQGQLHVAGYMGGDLGGVENKKKKRKLRKDMPTVTKAQAKYQALPHNDERCGRCAMFIGPDSANTNACDTVIGNISPDGWCQLFQWRESQRNAKDTGTPRPNAVNMVGKANWKDDVMRKVGARHSKSDMESLQQIHDHAVGLGATCHGLNGYEADKEDVEKNIRIAKVDESLGIVMGWAIVSKINGEPYYDLNIDKGGVRVPEHIPEDAMLKASIDFMEHSRVGNEMHSGDDKGVFVGAFPMTTEIAKAFGIDTPTTGLMVVYKPPPDVFAKFVSGEYKGFSIEGARLQVEEIE